jgi:3-methyladenine DNA glycosylase AlkD
METPEEIRKRFLANAETKYQIFSERTVVPKDHNVIGIRTPIVRKYAKEICAGDWRSYLNEIKDEYSEDLMLRGFIIAQAKTDEDERSRLTNEFVPNIDNWAVCDSFASSLKVNKRNMTSVWNMILPLIKTEEEFQVRFTIAMMLFHFVNEEYIGKIIQYMDTIKNDLYYVKMAVAWCLSTCFIKFQNETMTYLKNNTLDTFTFNKTLSKITDSLRVGDKMKDTIKQMRRK